MLDVAVFIADLGNDGRWYRVLDVLEDSSLVSSEESEVLLLDEVLVVGQCIISKGPPFDHGEGARAWDDRDCWDDSRSDSDSIVEIDLL